MKSKLHYFACLLLCVAMGCKPSNRKIAKLEGVERIMKLKNNLGELRIIVPSFYDTVIQWTDRSDCYSCGYEKYRFQIKNNPIALERGIIWKGDPSDSVDDITISHSIVRYSLSSDSQISDRDHRRIVHEYALDLRFYPIVSDTLMKIGSRLYSLSFSKSYDSSKALFKKAVIGATLVHGEEVFIQFKKWSRSPIREDYFERSLGILESIKFINGH
jgi:hypothetical protein